jgi:hypothetical protein
MRVALYCLTAAMMVFAFLAQAVPATTSAQDDWESVQSWPGTGIGTTAPFDASGTEMRVSWNVQDSPTAPSGSGGASIQIQVYQQTSPTDTLVNTINAPGPGGQQTFSPPAGGMYYLQVTPITGDLPTWTIRVEQRPS